MDFKFSGPNPDTRVFYRLTVNDTGVDLKIVGYSILLSNIARKSKQLREELCQIRDKPMRDGEKAQVMLQALQNHARQVDWKINEPVPSPAKDATA